MKYLKLAYYNVEKVIAVSCLTFMLITLTFQTVARYFFHYSASWIEEISGYCLIWLVFTATSYAVLHDAHIRIDSVMGLYPQKMKKYIEILGKSVWLLFSILMTVSSFAYAMDSFAKGARAIAIPLPLWLVYFAIPFGHFFLSLRLIEQIVNHIRDLLRGVDFLADTPVVSISEDTGEDLEGGI